MVFYWISDARDQSLRLFMARHSRGLLLFPSYSSSESHGLVGKHINKCNSSQNPPLTGDSHVSAIGRRSASSLEFGGSTSSNGHLGPRSSRETLLPI